jgi:hypothetical protein
MCIRCIMNPQGVANALRTNEATFVQRCDPNRTPTSHRGKGRFRQVRAALLWMHHWCKDSSLTTEAVAVVQY